MTGINLIKLKSLKQTKNFYLWELKREDLTSKQKDSYLLAKETISKIINEREKAEEEKKIYSLRL